MNSTLYALCQKPVLGLILWLSFLCTFPPPLKETSIDVSASGNILSSKFHAPVAKAYFLSAIYSFPSVQDRIKDSIVRGAATIEHCYGKDAKQFDSYPDSVRSSMGRPLRLRVIIKSLTKGEVIYSQSLASVCQTGHDGATRKTQVIALIELPEGHLSIDVENVEPRQDLAAMHPKLIIHS